jgi:hypothetical protein
MLLGTRVSLTRYRYFLRAYFGTFRGCTLDDSIRLPVLRIVARSVRDRCEIGARSVRSGRKRCRGKYFPCAAAGQMRGRIGAPVYLAVLGVLGEDQRLRCTRPYSVYSAMLGSCSIMVRAVLIHDARAVLNLVRYSSVDTRIRYSR